MDNRFILLEEAEVDLGGCAPIRRRYRLSLLYHHRRNDAWSGDYFSGMPVPGKWQI